MTFIHKNSNANNNNNTFNKINKINKTNILEKSHINKINNATIKEKMRAIKQYQEDKQCINPTNNQLKVLIILLPLLILLFSQKQKTIQIKPGKNNQKNRKQKIDKNENSAKIK